MLGDRPNLAAWQNETGKDTPNSFSADPLFVSASFLRPQVGSPLLGAGQSIAGITTDIVGDPRGNPPTVGAYELADGPPRHRRRLRRLRRRHLRLRRHHLHRLHHRHLHLRLRRQPPPPPPTPTATSAGLRRRSHDSGRSRDS